MKCPDCGGSGMGNYGFTHNIRDWKCPDCKGTGKVMDISPWERITDYFNRLIARGEERRNKNEQPK